MNSSTPNRTLAVHALVQNFKIIAADIKEFKNDPMEVNYALAFCEVAMKIPPSWFTAAERMLIVGIITELYGDPHKFLNDLQENSVSFYNKACHTSKLGHDIVDTVSRLHELHEKQFGAMN